jgi:hypothetical protein
MTHGDRIDHMTMNALHLDMLIHSHAVRDPASPAHIVR